MPEAPKTTLSLMCTLAIQGAVAGTLSAEFQRRTGLGLNTVFDPTALLLKRIASGEKADVIVAVRETLDALAMDGVVTSASVKPVVLSGLGVAVAPGARHPDISTPEAFRQALLSARSLAYSRSGASGQYVAAMLAKMGIADQVNAKATVVPGGFTAEALFDGRADLAVQQMSELKAVEHAEIVGPFPLGVQSTTQFAAAIFTASRQPQAAQTLIDFLASPAAAPAYRAFGLEVAR